GKLLAESRADGKDESEGEDEAKRSRVSHALVRVRSPLLGNPIPPGQAPLIGQKKSPGTNPGLTNNPRRRPTLPRGLPRSTIGAEGLNCRVRNGNGCGPFTRITAKTNYEFSVVSSQFSV